MEWMIFYIIGMMFLIVGGVVVVHKRKNNKAILYLLASLFFTLFVWYIPIEIYKDIYTVPEGILSALLQSIGALKGDGYIKSFVEPVWACTLYSTSIMIVRTIIFPLVFGVVLSFFRTPYLVVANSLRKHKKTYVFLGVTTKNINIAKSIYIKGPCRLIFISENKDNESWQEDLNDVDALVFEKSIRYVFGKIVKDKKVFSEESPLEVFIFNENEEKNLNALRELCEIVGGDDKTNLRIYVESRDLSWANQNLIQELYNSNSNISMNFVGEHDTFAFNNLYNNNLLEKYVKEDGIKKIKVLLIGIDNYSIAMLKCMLWLVQLPEYKLEICIIDNGEYIDKFTSSYPGIKKEMDELGLALYKMEMYENISYQSKKFIDIITTHSDFTFAFLNGQDMGTNSNLVDTLSTIRARKEADNNFIMHVKNDLKSVFSNIQEYPWNHVLEVGTIPEVYSYEFLTNSSIEKAARSIHEERQLHKAKKTPWKCYSKDEYMRYSVYARALSLRYKLSVIKQFYDADYSLLSTYDWKKSEHRRWDVYTWVLGYIKGDETDKKIKKVHTDLIPFDELSLETQNNDAIEVNDSIVKSLCFNYE